jgi:glycosyltransferase involved in cell wall biosynthesis
MSIIKSFKKTIKEILPPKVCDAIRTIQYYIFHYRPLLLIFSNKKENQQLVSVIIPSYKSTHFLREAVTSVLNQTYKNVQILIMTDVPEEDAKGKISDLIGNINYFENKNLHTIQKFNSLVEKTKGALVIFLCEDDMLDKSFIEKTVYLMEKKTVDIVYTDMKWIGKNSGSGQAGNWIEKDFIITTPVFITALFKKEVWEKTGKYKEVVYFDWDFWWRTYAKGFSAYHLKEPLFFYRAHSGQDSHNYNYEKEKKDFLESHKYLLSKKYLTNNHI